MAKNQPAWGLGIWSWTSADNSSITLISVFCISIFIAIIIIIITTITHPPPAWICACSVDCSDWGLAWGYAGGHVFYWWWCSCFWFDVKRWWSKERNIVLKIFLETHFILSTFPKEPCFPDRGPGWNAKSRKCFGVKGVVQIVISVLVKQLHGGRSSRCWSAFLNLGDTNIVKYPVGWPDDESRIPKLSTYLQLNPPLPSKNAWFSKVLDTVIPRSA